MTRTRQAPEARREQIGEAAQRVANRSGAYAEGFSLEAVAVEARVSVSTVRHYFGALEALRDAVIEHAIATKNKPIIEQARVMRHPKVQP